MTDEVKAGARHSKRDKRLLQDVKSSAARIVEAAVELGADEDDVREAVQDGAAGKAVSLDQQSEWVRRAIYDATMVQVAYNEIPVENWVTEVYEDYAILCVEHDHYKVPYTLDGTTVTVAPRDQWQPVEKEWVPASTASMKAETLVAFGNTVKALGDGKVGGYLVRFSTDADPDLTGEFFTAQTYFGPRDGDGADTLFHHGMPVKSGLEALADRLLKPLKTRKDEVGVWAETVLDMADEYEKTIYQLVEAGKLGWSSGAPGHMVRKLETGEITRWPIAEGSLTPTPAEPRNRVLSLKALDATPLSVEIVDSRQGAANNQEVTMSEIQGAAPAVETTERGVDVQAIVAEAVTKALADFQQKLEAEPAIKSAGYAVPSVHIRKPGEKVGAEVAFKAYLHRQDVTDPAVKATLNETTDAQGGYAVPTQFANEIVLPLADASFLRAAGARVIRLNGTDSFKLPSLTFSAAAVLKAESASYSQSEPTMGEVEFNPYKLTKLSKVTEELVADSRFDVWTQILQPDWTQAFAAAENSYFTTGTGSSQPQGVVAGSSLGVTAASGTAITADEVIDLVHSVSYLYRQRGKFMMHDTTLRELRQLKDGSGRYLWSVDGGLNGAPTGSLLGYPVLTNNSMATIATGEKTILFGDFSYYVIADWDGVGMQRLDELYAGTGEVGFRGYRRVDGNVILSAAIKHLIQA